jgi:molybdopterin synthase sulfur carrier subunit
MDLGIATVTVSVMLPSVLRPRTGGRGAVEASGATVREVIDSLEAHYPGLRFNLCYETGELRPFVNIFVGPENIRYLQGLDTPVSTGDALRIIQSVAGG